MINTLEIEGIQLSYGNRTILSDVYLKCETGKVVGLLGGNGAGKTSIFKTAFGILKVEGSSLRLNNIAITQLKDKSAILSFLPQHQFIPQSLTLEKIFNDFQISITSFVESFPAFKSKEHLALRHFSTGEKRLAEVYIIVMSDAMFALLDEPFTYITPIEIEKIKALIIAQKQSKGFIISDHSYRHVLEVRDVLYLLSEGATTLIKNKETLVDRGYLPVER